jgi:hypothetical protein
MSNFLHKHHFFFIPATHISILVYFVCIYGRNGRLMPKALHSSATDCPAAFRMAPETPTQWGTTWV